MKKTALFIGLLTSLSSPALAGEIHYTSAKDTDKELWELFVNPPDSTRTKVWWFHGETETTREGIEADLKAVSDKGVGGSRHRGAVQQSAGRRCMSSTGCLMYMRLAA